MHRIYKYPLVITDHQMIRVPLQCRLLSVQSQHEGLMLWALVEPDASQDQCLLYIRIVGTGNPFPDAMEFPHYVGTVQTGGGLFVWHVFEGKDRRKV